MASNAFLADICSPLRTKNGRTDTAGVSRTSGLVWPDVIWNGKWHHVAGTFDGATAKLFFDGKLIADPVGASQPVDYNMPTSGDASLGGFLGTCDLYYTGGSGGIYLGVHGSDDRDDVDGDDGADFVTGDQGQDNVRGGGGDDLVSGEGDGGDQDFLYGGSGNDVCDGGANDVIDSRCES